MDRELPLAILSCGMATAVGLSAQSTCAAVRGRIAGFQETNFIARDCGLTVAAVVPFERAFRGNRRLLHLILGPLGECLELAPELQIEEIPLLLAVAEADRVGRFDNLDSELSSLIEEAFGKPFHSASRIFPFGRVATAISLRYASRLVHERGFQKVIVAGVDSYISRPTLESLDDRSRLKTRENSNGFIPGEAGAALLVGPVGKTTDLTFLSSGFATENATIGGGQPLRGEGLAAAYRQALEGANLGLHQIDYRMGDLSGEQYRFKEAALALARVMRVRREAQELWHPADTIGETGAAALPCMLSVAYWAARKSYAPGPRLLAHVGNDDGKRAAIVLESALER